MNEPKPEPGILHKTRLILSRVEDGFLVSLLALMLVMAVVQIVLRNLFSGGLNWADMLLRMSVLWVGLAGGMVAARKNAHIRIDVITRFLPDRIKTVASALVELFAAAVCAIVAWHAMDIVRMEHQDATIAFARVPVYLCASIIPVAFGLMAARYLVWALTHAKEAIRG